MSADVRTAKRKEFIFFFKPESYVGFREAVHIVRNHKVITILKLPLFPIFKQIHP